MESRLNNTDKARVLVIGKPNPRLIKTIECEFLKDKRERIFITDAVLPNKFSLKIKTFNDYWAKIDIKYNHILQETHNLIRTLGNAHIDDEVPLKDFVLYKGVSLWEMAKPYLLSKLTPILKGLFLVEAIIELEKPGEIIIFKGEGELGELFRIIGETKGIPTRTYATKKEFLDTNFKRQVLSIEYFFKKIWRFFKSLYFISLNKVSFPMGGYRNRPMVLFFNHVERNLDAILPVILRYDAAERLVINMPRCGCEKRLKKEHVDFKYFYGYQINKIFDKSSDIFLNNIWTTINKSIQFQEQFIYKKVDLSSLLMDIFWNLIFIISPGLIYNIDAARKIFLSCKTRAVVVVDTGIEVVLPARSLSFPTIAILPSSPDELRYYGGIVTDYVTATGINWEENLLKLGARREQIYISGPTKFDLILNNRFNRNEILQELGLDPNKKTILYASSYPCESMGFSYEHYMYEMKMVFKSISSIKDLNFIVKVHPYDYNFKIFEKISKQMGCTKILIIRDFNIWKLLFCCDLLINAFSTVSYEAVLMDKIVILLCYVYKYFPQDIWNLDKKKAAIFIKEFSELKETIEESLFNLEKQDILSVNRKKYILDYASPFDGKASYRAKELIEKAALKYGQEKQFFRETVPYAENFYAGALHYLPRIER